MSIAKNLFIKIRAHVYLSMCIFFICIGLFYLACALVITIVPAYKQEITQELSHRIGQPLEFSHVNFTWRGFKLYAKVYNVKLNQKVNQISNNKNKNRTVKFYIKNIACIEVLMQPVKSLFSLKPKFDSITVNTGTVVFNNQPEELAQNIENLDLNKINLKKYLASILNQEYLGWISVKNINLKNIEVIINTRKNNIDYVDDFILADGKLHQASSTNKSSYLYGLVYKVNYINPDNKLNKPRQKIELAIKYNHRLNHKFYFASNDEKLLDLIHDVIKQKAKSIKQVNIDPNTEIKLWGQINSNNFESFDLENKIQVYLTSPEISLEFNNNKLALKKIDGLIIYESDNFTNQDVYKLNFVDFKTVMANTEFIINSTIIRNNQDKSSYIKSDISFGQTDLKSFFENLPLFIIGQDTHKWLVNNIEKGTLGKSRLLIRGYLDGSFPYDPKYDNINSNSNGIFILRSEILNTDLNYSKNNRWPKLEHLNGVLTLRGRDINITSHSAIIQNNQINNLTASIKGLGRPEASDLKINASILSAGDKLAKIIETTPLYENLSGVNEWAKFDGPIDLNLNLLIPIMGETEKKVEVNGKINFNKTNLNIPKTPLNFTNLNGQLNFTDNSVDSEGLIAEYNNKLAPIEVNYKNSNLDILLKSVLDSKYILDYYNLDYSRYISGSSKFDLNLNINNILKLLKISIKSDLEGVNINLPNLSIISILSKNSVNKKQEEKLEAFFDITSNLDSEIVRYSLKLEDKFKNKNNYSVFDYIKNNKFSSLAILTPDTVGNINFITDQNKINNKINADFSKLSFNTQNTQNTQNTEEQESLNKQETNIDFFSLPELKVYIKEFNYNNKPVGNIEFNTLSDKKEKVFKIMGAKLSGVDNLSNFSNLNFNLESKKEDSQLNTVFNGYFIDLDVPGVLKLINNLDIKDQVKINGSYNLNWPGNILDIDLKETNGQVIINSGYGRINDVKLGVGRLFGFLNLELLDKRLRFDFSDVFEPGFKFDNIKGKFNISHGNLNTDKLFISAGSADAELYGDVDLINKSYNINADIRPHLTSSLPVAAAVVGTPVAGAVVFLVDKILESPVDQLSERSYSVTGSWNDPLIKKLENKRGPLIELSWLKDQKENTEAIWRGIFDRSDN